MKVYLQDIVNAGETTMIVVKLTILEATFLVRGVRQMHAELKRVLTLFTKHRSIW